MDDKRPFTLTPAAKEKLTKVSTATLTSQLIGHGFSNTFLTGVRPLRPDLRMVGYAVTLRFVPGREDMVAKTAVLSQNPQRLAIEAVGPEDVLVAEARGELRSAVIGDILAWRMKVLGAAGFVTDGALRDTPGCAEIDMPIYLQAPQATRSNVWHHPADMNVPIGCAGVLIMPGDVIVGDGEGVVAIPAQVAEDVAHAAYEQELREAFVLELVKAGASTLDVYPHKGETLTAFAAWRERQESNQ